MSRRVELQSVLEELLGSRNVYFQPPENLTMQYDCIVYTLDKIDADQADNNPYQLHNRYQVTAIYRDPDSELPTKLAMLPMCAHDRHFTSDNLNHDVFNLYF